MKIVLLPYITIKCPKCQCLLEVDIIDIGKSYEKTDRFGEQVTWHKINEPCPNCLTEIGISENKYNEITEYHKRKKQNKIWKNKHTHSLTV